MPKYQKNWMRLDNAALIYPAVKNRNWMAMFRITANMTEPVDSTVLEKALKSTLRRFPAFGVRMRRGLFWFYLEQIHADPKIQKDVANPCVRMKLSENDGYMFRVRYYQKRIAVEFFHVVTDGAGGMSFFKTLLAEYLRLKYGAQIPRDNEILDCTQEPQQEESEDAFIRYARKATKSRSELSAYYLKGTRESHNFIHIITGIVDSDILLRKAKEKNVTLTAYLTAVLIVALDKLQRQNGMPQKRLKPVKICIPINLRNFYQTTTKRNFSQYLNPGIQPRFGEHTFDEILQQVHYFLKLEINEKNLNARFSHNVLDSVHPILRITPLFLKNVALRATYNSVGDSLSTSCISNLGLITLPPEMERHVLRMNAILGPYLRNPVVCASLSYKGKTYLDFTRTIRETDVEREFFTFLVDQGIPVTLESNNLYETENF